jgi:hypothetical protein
VTVGPAASGVVSNLNGFHFPAWSRPLPAAPPGLQVTVGADDLRVEGALVAPMPSKELRVHGFDGSYKNRPNGLSVLPLAAALEAQHATDAVLAVDVETPYRILSEVIFTLGQGGVSTFHFLATYRTADGLKLGSVDVHAPKRGSDGFPVTHPVAPIEVGLQPESIVLRANGKTAPDNCGEIASVGGKHDFAAVSRCGSALKAAEGLTGDLMLLAKPVVPFGVVVSTMNALAQDYPQIILGIMP